MSFRKLSLALFLVGTSIGARAADITKIPFSMVNGMVPPAQGGTGKTSFNAGTDYLAPGGALGTPSALGLANATGLPLASGVTGALSPANGGTGASTPAAALANLGGLNKTGDTMTGILQNTTGLVLSPIGGSQTAGAYTGDSSATWVPAVSALGVFASQGQAFTIYPTRGTTSSNGIYPPSAGYGTPTSNVTANMLIQSKGDGNNATQANGLFINLDVAGGTQSQAHPSDSQSPNATGFLVSAHQHVDAQGNAPPTMWGGNIDVVRGPNSGAAQTYGLELDLSNFSGQDCGIGGNCITAWYFYGGINGTPNLAYHYISNELTSSYSGTATTSGNVFTAVTGSFSTIMNTLVFAGTTYRVTCSSTTKCTADVPLGTNSATGFTGRSAGAHEGFFFQDGPNGNVVQDNDIFAADSAQTLIRAQGYHAVGLDFTGDAMPNAAFLKSGQNICFNVATGCQSYSTGLASWLFSPTTSQSDYVALISNAGNMALKGSLTTTRIAGSGTPGLSGCGTTPSLTPGSSNLSGTIIEGTSATGCTVTFSAGFANTPACTVTAYNNSGAPVTTMSVTTGAFAFNNASSSNQRYAYVCTGI